MNNKDPYTSLAEAASTLGYADSNTLRQWARDKKIPGAIKIGKTWAVPTEWVEGQKLVEPPGKGWRRGRRGKNSGAG